MFLRIVPIVNHHLEPPILGEYFLGHFFQCIEESQIQGMSVFFKLNSEFNDLINTRPWPFFEPNHPSFFLKTKARVLVLVMIFY